MDNVSALPLTGSPASSAQGIITGKAMLPQEDVTDLFLGRHRKSSKRKYAEILDRKSGLRMARETGERDVC